ncbi:hypothetical protein DAI22_07g140250 [Oryza sativa Japonica Group]|nr:hypothetical protein DAI22_07g140250 [Oryza sativa Japonica Group]
MNFRCGTKSNKLDTSSCMCYSTPAGLARRVKTLILFRLYIGLSLLVKLRYRLGFGCLSELLGYRSGSSFSREQRFR